MVEMITGIVFYWAAANAAGSPLNFLNSILFLSGLTVVFFIDLDHLIIPDKVVLPLAVIGLALGLFPWEAGHKVFLSRLEGAAAGFFGFWAIAEAGTYMLRFEDKLGTEIGSLLLFTKVFYKGETDMPRDAMGGGDIKLAAMMGAFLGLKLLGVGLFIAFLIGSVLAVGLILSGRRDAKDAVPFGPMMAAGGAIALIKGEAAIQWYAGFVASLWGL